MIHSAPAGLSVYSNKEMMVQAPAEPPVYLFQEAPLELFFSETVFFYKEEAPAGVKKFHNKDGIHSMIPLLSVSLFNPAGEFPLPHYPGLPMID